MSVSISEFDFYIIDDSLAAIWTDLSASEFDFYIIDDSLAAIWTDLSAFCLSRFSLYAIFTIVLPINA